MSKCIRRVIKPIEESYVKCDKCGKDISETETMSNPNALPGFGSRLWVRSKIEQIIFDPSGHIPEQINTHDLCQECYTKFLNWLEED